MDCFGFPEQSFIIILMKRILTILLLFAVFSITAAAQYEPTSTWPYLYKDFTEGEILLNIGNPKKAKLNVHVSKSRLHFIDGGYICEANMPDISSVRIGDDFYTNAGGRMMKILAKSSMSIVAEEILVDPVRLNATGGAYGSSSSTLSTTALSAIEQTTVGGRTELTRLVSGKEDGQTLPLMDKMYMVFKGWVVYASRKDVLETFPEYKDDLSRFMKENKIKWKDPQSLLKLADYISEKL